MAQLLRLSLREQLTEDGISEFTLVTYLKEHSDNPDVLIQLPDLSVLVYSPCSIGGEETWMCRTWEEYVGE